MAHKYRSFTVNVVSSGSPSRIRRVLLISLGITMRPRSSTLRTIPVAFIYLLSSLMSNYDASICKQRTIIPMILPLLSVKRFRLEGSENLLLSGCRRSIILINRLEAASADIDLKNKFSEQRPEGAVHPYIG